MTREDEIKLIAYKIWEEEGCCQGRDVDHWIRAEMIWEQQQVQTKSLTAKNSIKTSTKMKKRRISTQSKS